MSTYSDLSIDSSFLIQNDQKTPLAYMKNLNFCERLVRIGEPREQKNKQFKSHQRSKSKFKQPETELSPKLITDLIQDFHTACRSHHPGERFRFKRITEVHKFQDSLRKKFASYYIRERIGINHVIKAQEIKTVYSIKDQLLRYQASMSIDQEAIRRQTMKKIQSVKGYYEKSGQFIHNVNP